MRCRRCRQRSRAHPGSPSNLRTRRDARRRAGCARRRRHPRVDRRRGRSGSSWQISPRRSLATPPGLRTARAKTGMFREDGDPARAIRRSPLQETRTRSVATRPPWSSTCNPGVRTGRRNRSPPRPSRAESSTTIPPGRLAWVYDPVGIPARRFRRRSPVRESSSAPRGRTQRCTKAELSLRDRAAAGSTTVPPSPRSSRDRADSRPRARRDGLGGG